MAFSTIDKSTLHMNANLWTGDGSSQAITGVGFQPDATWIKGRHVSSHKMTDSARGVTKEVEPNSTGAEYTEANGLTAFGADGYTVGSNGAYNGNGNDYVGWSWKGGGAGSANTDGTISSTVSVNATAGFSLVTYTGNGTQDATFGHGLGKAVKLVIIKNRSTTEGWVVGHKSLPFTKLMKLDTGNAQSTSSAYFGNVNPSTTVVTLGNDGGVNNSGDNYVAYCWAPITGYSSFGQYEGNNSTDGPFIYTGFRPLFMITKSKTSGEAWNINDGVRITGQSSALRRNPNGYFMYCNNTGAEHTALTHNEIDLYCNGFKLRAAHGQYNGTDTHIYMAFGQPLVSNGGVVTPGR